jgi:hypothetical protein
MRYFTYLISKSIDFHFFNKYNKNKQYIFLGGGCDKVSQKFSDEVK